MECHRLSLPSFLSSKRPSSTPRLLFSHGVFTVDGPMMVILCSLFVMFCAIAGLLLVPELRTILSAALLAEIAIILAVLGKSRFVLSVSSTLPIEIFLSVCEIVGSVLVFVACWKYQASFLIPILVFCVLSSILDVIEFFTYIIWAFLENSENRKEVDTIIATFDAVSFVLLIWFFINFKSCYEYLRALESSPQKFVREEEESQEYVCHM